MFRKILSEAREVAVDLLLWSFLVGLTLAAWSSAIQVMP